MRGLSAVPPQDIPGYASLLAAYIHEQGMQCLPPDLVTGLVGMEQIVHDFLGERAVWLEELVVEIKPKDILAIGIAFDDRVDLGVADAQLVRRLRVAREDRHKGYLGFWMLLAYYVNDALDAVCDAGYIVRLVVGSDHNREELCLVSFKFAILTIINTCF